MPTRNPHLGLSNNAARQGASRALRLLLARGLFVLSLLAFATPANAQKEADTCAAPIAAYEVTAWNAYETLGGCGWARLEMPVRRGTSLNWNHAYAVGNVSTAHSIGHAEGGACSFTLDSASSREVGNGLFWYGVCGETVVSVFLRGLPGTPVEVRVDKSWSAQTSTTASCYSGSVYTPGHQTDFPNSDGGTDPTEVLHGNLGGAPYYFEDYPNTPFYRVHVRSYGATHTIYGYCGGGFVSARGQATVRITASLLVGEPPSGGISGPERATVLEPVVFTSTAADPENGPLTYKWTAERAATTEGQDTPAATFTWAEPDTYTVTCEVVDCDGRRASETDSVIVVGPCAGPMATGACPPCRATLYGPDVVYGCKQDLCKDGSYWGGEYYHLVVKFEEPCECCEYRQEVTSFTRVYKLFNIIPVTVRDYGQTHEDTADGGGVSKCRGTAICNRNPLRYGYRHDVPCPDFDQWPAGTDGCTYEFFDRPEVSGVPEGSHFVSKKRFDGYVVGVRSPGNCENADTSKRLLKTWWSVCEGDAGDRGESGQAILVDGPTRGEFMQPGWISGDDDVVPIGESEIMVGNKAFKVDFSLVRSLLGERFFEVVVRVKDNSREEAALAQGLKLSIRGLNPHPIESSVAKRHTYYDSEHHSWDVPFLFSLPPTRPDSVEVSLSTPTAEVAFAQKLVWPNLNSTSAVPDPKNTPKRMRILNNPARGPVTILVSAETPIEAVVRVFDISGRLVRRLTEGRFSPGENLTTWDQRDDAGRPVPSGLYFLRFEGPGFVEKARLVVL